MWKTILNNINQLVLTNWKSVFFLVLGIAVGGFLFSCSMINSAIDKGQEIGNAVADTTVDGVEYVTDGIGLTDSEDSE
jgi:hypothetical protein|tara:strand:+ start:9936 stop:10169 length:234 start_codon:yes stop_codon:yes gene_type:complete